MEPLKKARFVMDTSGRTMWSPNGEVKEGKEQEPVKQAKGQPIKISSAPLDEKQMVSFA